MSKNNFKDLTEMKFGYLVVKSRAENKGKEPCWNCYCENCESDYIAIGALLKNGSVKACGCLRGKKSTHGLSKTKIYSVWANIKDRCLNEKAKRFKDYGGRGIKVCNDWIDNFQSFFYWAINNGYQEGLSIERKNNDGNYEPDNCKWATSKEQAQNRRKPERGLIT